MTLVLPEPHRSRLRDLADYLAVALAATLPWSTSATGILVVLWLLAFLPTLDLSAMRRVIGTAAGGFVILFVVFGFVGMAWSNVPIQDRLVGFVPYLRLLLIPFLFCHFQRSDRGLWVIYSLLISCGSLLLVSYYIYVFQPIGGYPFAYKQFGVPVKDYISQSGFFTLAAFVLIDAAWRDWHNLLRTRTVLLAAGAFAFLLNIAMVATGRTALATIAILLAVFALRVAGWRARIAVLLLGAVLAGLAWTSSPYLRFRVTGVFTEISDHQASGALTSSGIRLDMWRTSLQIVAQAPLLGHGTGSINQAFDNARATGASIMAGVTNPHNQTLVVAIQLGLVGAILLYAMWIFHLLLFRGEGIVVWFGIVTVVQNIAGSVVNSHLFDFTQGWTYIVSVGVAGGIMLRQRLGSEAVLPDTKPESGPPRPAMIGQAGE